MNKPEDMTLLNRFKRKYYDTKHKDMAALIGVSPPFLCRVFKNKQKLPSKRRYLIINLIANKYD